MKHVWVPAILFFAFLATRLYFIFTFPPFTDESLYIRWGMLMIDKPGFAWASIEHISRQPLAFWLFGFGAILFKNPIIGARLIMLVCNVPTFFILYSGMRRTFDGKAALIAVAIFTFTPLFILTQTLAIMDGLLFAITTYILWIILLVYERYSFKHTLTIALILAISLWIKTTALFLELLSLITILTVLIRNRVRTSIMQIHIVIFFLVQSVLIVPLVSRPDFIKIFQEPQSFLFSTTQLTQFATIWATNITTTLYSTFLYIGPFLCLTLLFSLSMLRKRMYTVALAWALFPVVSLILVASNFRFRYVALGMICLIPFMTFGVRKIFRTMNHAFIPPIFWSGVILYGLVFIWNPVTIFALFPKSNGERDYALSWPSGYGIPELIQWIDSNTLGKEIVIAVVDSPGNPSDYLLSNYYFSPTVHVTFITVNSLSEFRKIEPLTQKIPVFLATRESLIRPEISPYLTKIIRFEKPLNQDAISFYAISF